MAGLVELAVRIALSVAFCVLLAAVFRLQDHDVDREHARRTAAHLCCRQDVPLAEACTPYAGPAACDRHVDGDLGGEVPPVPHVDWSVGPNAAR